MQKNEILVAYGTDGAALAKQLCEAANLAALIGDAARRVGLKPNLVNSSPAARGATTHPEVVAGVIGYLQANGFKNLCILEGSWVGERTPRALKRCGYTELSQETGVGIIDTQQDSATKQNCAGLDIDVCDSALAVDFMINLPVMKGHCQTRVTCALKNMKGVIPDREKRRFHQLGLHKPIAHLNCVAKSDFIVVDALCGDPDFEEGGNPQKADRLFAARDAVLCDAFVCGLLGYALADVPYIEMAEVLGVGSANVAAAAITELNQNPGGALPRPSGAARGLARYMEEDGACSACYAALAAALNALPAPQRARLKSAVCVGQGFKGKTGTLGSGACCAGFEAFVPGCPPAPQEIEAFLVQHSR